MSQASYFFVKMQHVIPKTIIIQNRYIFQSYCFYD
jgi:hypothetical protein